MKTSQLDHQYQSIPLTTLSQLITTHCLFNSQAIFVCSNQKCTLNPFICATHSCHCHQSHPTCPQILINSLKRNIQAKIVPLKKTQESIISQIQKTIDELSDFKQKLITQMQNTLQLIGLTENDQKLLNFLNSQGQQSLTGKKLFQMFNFMMVGQKVQSKNDLFESQFTKIWQSLNKQIQLKTLKISQTLKNLQENKQISASDIFQDSKIIEGKENRDKLIKFFVSKKIESTKLLYQALSNKYSIDEFHNNCDNIPHTLTICETVFGNVIGGYTPLVWDKNSASEYLKDESGSSFIFSLTNNDKLVLDKSKTAIYRCNPHGPLFGDGNSDLGISAPSSDCWSLVGRSYTNENYKGGVECYERFNGNPGKSYYFGIKKWQVWQINFSDY